MKVLMINVVCGIRSTGRICTDLATALEAQGHEVKIAYGRENVPEQFQKYAVRIGSDFDVRKNALASRILDNEGFNATRETRRLLEWASTYNPDVLWLHNLHGYYINIEELFLWIKTRPKMKVKWTLHDCWAFTGHCAYYSYYGCEKWQTSCSRCPLKGDYPHSLFRDRSERNYRKKKALFTGVSDLSIIVPSYWMEKQVKKSFLREYPIEVIYNQIDRHVFVPTNSNFRSRFNITNEIVVLGVAAVWDKRKGLDDFIVLSKLLPDNYKIVIVGLTKRQIKKMPKSIIALGKTNSKKELAEIYSAADIFLNPSKEETFGLTTLEASSCGAKCIVIKGTACEEVAELFEGIVVNDSINEIKEAVLMLGEEIAVNKNTL